MTSSTFCWNIKKDASSRKSSDEYRVSFDIMPDHNLWEVTIIPSVLSETASSNDTTAPSVTILNEHNEYKCLYLPSDRDRNESERTCEGKYVRGDERSKMTSLPLVHQRSNRDNSRRTLNSNKEMPVLHADERELDDRTDGRVNKEENTRQFSAYEVTENESRALFIEVGAIYKILDFVTDSDPRVSSLTGNCCDEISRTLRCLVAQRRDKNLEDFLLNDSSLYRCERCGVISSYVLESRSVSDEIKGTRIARGIEITKRDNVNDVQNGKQIEISGNPAASKDNARSRVFVNNPEVDRRAKYKAGLNEPESLPVKERAFVTGSRSGRPNDAGSTSDTEANSKIKNTSRPINSAVQKLLTNFERTTKRRERYEFDCVAQNYRLREDDPATATNIEEERIVRKVSYDSKSRIDDMPGAERRFETAQKTRRLRRPFEKSDDSDAVTDTVKYLARGGQSATLDKEENDLLSKLRERLGIRAEDARKRQSFVLYDSRDDCPQCYSGFWLFDKSGNLSEIPADEPRYLAVPKPDNNSVNLHANVPRYFNAGRNTAEETIGRTGCMEKDSLDSCAGLERGRQSDTTTFVSSSSAENLMHEWMASSDGKSGINDVDEDVGRGRKLVSSRPSLDIARHVRAEIEEDRRADDAKKSMREPRARDSNIFAGLSPETRRRICYLIERIASSDSAKDSLFRDEKRLATNALNSGKSLRSKSVDATLVCDKPGEVTNNLMNDCIPTRLSDVAENKNRSLERQDNVADARSQDLDACNVSRGDSSDRIVRRIIYKDVSSRDIADNNAEILLAYRKILENSEDMNWNGFRQLVEHLHPRQTRLWRDVCRTIGKMASRMTSDANDGTEICIEISPIAHEETLKTGKVTACTREIVFELDMTLEGVDGFLNGEPRLSSKKRFDARKDVDEGVAG